MLDTLNKKKELDVTFCECTIVFDGFIFVIYIVFVAHPQAATTSTLFSASLAPLPMSSTNSEEG